ncbi:MAG: thiamine biosynthesis protein ThiF [Peptococcaceae bacterium BRH_c8a]|nr:MAG: thiamine biosynthesis protein ThiF [Peptococcaceae bacterium BRH_c8a]
MSSIFERTELLIGRAGLAKLAASKVAVFGLGGVGSFTAEALARAGIGALFLVDHDTVSTSNINRQLHALSHTVGLPKTAIMAERLQGINPTLKLETRQQKFTPDAAAEMLDEQQLNFVVDAIDDVDNKIALLVHCVRQQIPVISAMGAGNKLDPTSFRVDSIWNTTVCPLARTVRKKLRAAGIEENIPVVYSTASPIAVPNAREGERPVPGSISYVPSVAGLCMAGYVVDKLLGLGVFNNMN